MNMESYGQTVGSARVTGEPVVQFGANLASLGDILEHNIKRAHELAGRIELLGTATFGAIPQEVSNGRDRDQPSLAAFMDQLSEALDRIDAGLSRF